MAEKKPVDPEVRKSFQEYLAACPALEEPPTGLVVSGMVLRSAKEGSFVLRTADQGQHEIPVEAVDAFNALPGTDMRAAELTLNRDALGPDLAATLGQAAGGGLKPQLDKLPVADKAVFDTLKEIGGGDKFPPADKLPPQDKLPPLDKQPPVDTLKEPLTDKQPPLDKQPPFDTLKEVGGGDTLKEAGKDPIQDTVKESFKDPIGDGGGNTGIADSLIENFPGGGMPGDPVMQARAMMSRGFEPPKPTLDKLPPVDTHKEVAEDVRKPPVADTFKEVPKDPTKEAITDPQVDPLKGIPKDPFPDNTVKEGPKDPITDTFKEIGKDPLQDTLKEMGTDPIQDTFKEPVKDPIQDTFKEVPKDPIRDTVKESFKDPIGDGGGGNTGIADTLVENFPGGGGMPGDPVMQARMAMAAAPQAQAQPQPQPQAKVPSFDTLKEVSGGDTLKEGPFDTLKEPISDTFKEAPWDTLKEIGNGDTLKEGPFDTIKEISGGDTFKEGPFDTLKEVGGDGTLWEPGGGTLAEGGGVFQGDPTQPVAGGGLGLAPFVLATPHQAPQGALAQQYLAAQMARGMVGL